MLFIEEKYKGFWPLPGGDRNYIKTLTHSLIAIKSNKFTKLEFMDWFSHKYGTKNTTTESYFDAVFKKIGLIDFKNDKLNLNGFGEKFLNTEDNSIILKQLINNIIGFEEILILLAEKQTQNIKEIYDEIERKCKPAWSTDAQIRWRLNWLLSLEYIDVTSDKYFLTSDGIKVYNEIYIKEKIAGKPSDEKPLEEQISHSDLEDKMLYIGQFFDFNSIKRPSINIMLPDDRRLKSSDKQLDGLWIKKIPMGGQIFYPIEIQIGGNLSDTIDRLETVSDFAQKAIVIIDENQEKIMIERLLAKRSKLLDKMICIRAEDVYKMVTATNSLKGFFEKLFKIT